MRFSVRILLISLFFLASFLLFKSPVNAQADSNIPRSQDYLSNSVNPDVPKNLNSLTQSVMTETLSALICQMTGINAKDQTKPCLGLDLKTGKIGYLSNSGGAIGLISQGIAMLYTPPIHGGDYFNYLAQNFGLSKPSYAAASDGYEQIKPLTNLWIKFRNITYFLFILVFILIGIGIMLRVKIDPRTVMTIQNQIPKIIVCLILITFSFAIAGFLIDLMQLSIYVIFNLLVEPNNAKDLKALSPAMARGANVLQFSTNGLDLLNIISKISLASTDVFNSALGISNQSTGFGGDIIAAIQRLFSITGMTWDGISLNIINVVYDSISLFTAIKVGAQVGQLVDIPILDFVVGAGVGGAVFESMEVFLRLLLPYLIVFLIVGFALLSTLIRLFLMLLKAYVMILIDIIFAPFWIVAGLVPSSDNSKGFGSWLKDIGANLAVFPTVYAMLLLSKAIGSAFEGVNATNMFVPPLISNATLGQLIGAIISFGLILITPDVAKIVKEFVKAPKGQLGGVGHAIGVGAGAINPSRLGQIGSSFYYMKYIPIPDRIRNLMGHKDKS